VDDPESQLLGSMVTAALNNKGNPFNTLEKQKNVLKDYTPGSYEDTLPDNVRSLVLTRQQFRTMKKSTGNTQKIPASCSQVTLPKDSDQSTSRITPLASKFQTSEGENNTEGTQTLEEETMAIEPTIQHSRLVLEQRGDPRLLEIIEFLVDKKLPRNQTLAKYILSTIHQYIVDKNGILRKIDVRTPRGQDLPPAVLLRSLWDETLRAYHEPTMSGYRKFNKLLGAISANYYFPSMSTYVGAYCLTCATCQRTVLGKVPVAPIKPYYAFYPGIIIHLDCTPGSRLIKRGNSHILAMIDSFSGYIRLYPIPQLDSKTTAHALLSYICINSMPLKIITDNGPAFANELMTELSLLLGLQNTFITPYNSKSNGKVENAHKTMQTMVRAYIDEYPDDWDTLIPLIEFAMNTSISDVTNYTPFFLHFGRHPIMPLDALYGSSIYQPVISTNQYVKQLQAERDNVFNWVLKKREIMAEKSKILQESKTGKKFSFYSLGNTVLLKNPKRVGDHGKKYNPIYHKEIYFIEEILNNGAYKIRDLKKEQPSFVVNIKNLKKIPKRYEINLHMHNDTISTTPVEVLPPEGGGGPNISKTQTLKMTPTLKYTK